LPIDADMIVRARPEVEWREFGGGPNQMCACLKGTCQVGPLEVRQRRAADRLDSRPSLGLRRGNQVQIN